MLAAALVALMPAASQALTLTNPGFETGDLTGWDTSGDVTTFTCAGAVIGCAPAGGTYFALLNNSTDGVGNASLRQTVSSVDAGTYKFGAWVSFGTDNAAGNFDQGQISLTVQIGGGPSIAVGFDPNALNGQFTIPGGGGFSFTPWFLLQGTLAFAGPAADILLNINVQDYSNGGLILAADNAFINAVPLPAALPLFASGIGAMGLLGWRRKKKAAALAA